MYYKTMLSILAKSLIISFQYNIESVYFFYSNPVFCFASLVLANFMCSVPCIVIQLYNVNQQNHHHQMALQPGVGFGLHYNMPSGFSVPWSISPFVYTHLSQVHGHVIQPSHSWSSSSSCCIISYLHHLPWLQHGLNFPCAKCQVRDCGLSG